MPISGLDGILANMDVYEQKIYTAMHNVALYFAPVVESEAKTNATWTDRTGNARQGLHGFVEDVSASVVLLVLQHKMEYGIFLELANGGRYAIILPTLEAHYNAVKSMVDEVFK